VAGGGVVSGYESKTESTGVPRQISRREFLQVAAAAGLTLGSASSLLAACGSSSGNAQASGSPRQGGNLVFARGGDPRTIDPSAGEQNSDIWTVLNMYDCLYAVTSDGHGSKPWLALAHEISSDELTWTFHLRPGVKFSDGRPMTSADAQFTIERAIKGLNGYIDAAIDTVDAPDPATVRIHTRHPWGPLLGDLSLYANAVLPKDLNGMSSAQFFAHPVGTGPFMLDHWKKGQELKLVRNPHYWQAGKPLLDSVTFTVLPDDNTRLLQLRGGQAHIVEFPPFSALSSLQQTPNISVDIFPSTSVSYIGMNERKPQFADVHVRRAISYAIDRQAIIKSVLFGHGQPANSFFSPAWPFYNPQTPDLWYDLAKAKQELAMSSFPHGFATTMMVIAGDTVNGGVAQIVQPNLQALGINMKIASYDPSTFQTLQLNHSYDMFPDYYTLDIGDPDEDVPWCVDPVRGGVDSLYTNYRNTDVMKWGLQAESTIDPTKRAAIYAKIQDQVAMDAPFAELYYSPYVYAHRDSVNGFTVYPTGNYHLEDVWLAS
jgi:peptide/nickel transport system substrate-binding protein